MSIKIACPHCQRPLAVPEGSAGKQGRCKACGSTFAIPHQQIADRAGVASATAAPGNAGKVEMECPHCGLVVRGLPATFAEPIACPDCKVTDFFEPPEPAPPGARDGQPWKKAPFLLGVGAAVLLLVAFASHSLFAKRSGEGSGDHAAAGAQPGEPAKAKEEQTRAATPGGAKKGAQEARAPSARAEEAAETPPASAARPSQETPAPSVPAEGKALKAPPVGAAPVEGQAAPEHARTSDEPKKGEGAQAQRPAAVKDAPLGRVARMLRDLETSDQELFKALARMGEEVRSPQHKANAWSTGGNWGHVTADGLKERLGPPDEAKDVDIPGFDEKALQLVIRIRKGHRYDWLWVVYNEAGRVCNLYVEKSGWEQADRDLKAYLRDGPRPSKDDTAGTAAPERTRGQLPKGLDNAKVAATAKELLTGSGGGSVVERSVRRAKSRAQLPNRKEVYAYWAVHLEKIFPNSRFNWSANGWAYTDVTLARMDYLYKDDEFQVAASEKLQQRLSKVPPVAFGRWGKALTEATGDAISEEEALLLLIQQDELFRNEVFDADLSGLRCQRVSTMPVPVVAQVSKRKSVDLAAAANLLAQADVLYDPQGRFQPEVWALVVADSAAKPGQVERDPIQPKPGPAVPARALLIVTEEGKAALCVKDKWALLDFAKRTPSHVRWVSIDRNGRCWLAGDGGVSCLDGRTVLTYRPQDGIPGGSISHVYEDSAGRIWISSWGAGIACLDGSRWTRFTKADGLCQDDVNGFAEDAAKRIWIGTNSFQTGGGVSIFESQGFMRGGFEGKLANLQVMSIAHDAEGRIFLGCIGGLVIVSSDLTSKMITPAQGLPQKTPQATFLDRRGRIWVGTWGGGVARVDGATNEVSTRDALPDAKRVGRICEDGEGTVWAASLDVGLWRFNADGWKSVATPSGMNNLRTVGAVPDAVAAQLLTWAK